MKAIFKPVGVLQTMRLSYQEICAGERPWIVLGNFRNDFFKDAIERRADLIKDPIEEPQNATLEQQQWAAFCASSVEFLCEKYNLPCPTWTSAFLPLAEPWFTGPNTHKQHVRDYLIKHTPMAFRKRNIFCGDRVFHNKHEHTPELLQRFRAFEEARNRDNQIK